MPAKTNEFFIGDFGMEIAQRQPDGAWFFDGMFFISNSELTRLVQWIEEGRDGKA